MMSGPKVSGSVAIMRKELRPVFLLLLSPHGQNRRLHLRIPNHDFCCRPV